MRATIKTTVMILGCMAFIIHPVFSQKKKVRDLILKSASHTPWAGGPAGFHGDRYFIDLTSRFTTEQVHPDTIWIGEKCFPLVYKDSLNNGVHQFNISATRNKNTTTWSIHIEQSFREEMGVNSNMDENGNEKSGNDCRPAVYKGKALITYSKGKKKKYFLIRAMKENPMIAYP